MRVTLALLFLAPLVAMFAIQSGTQQILPLMMGMSVLAIIAYFVFERPLEDQEEF